LSTKQCEQLQQFVERGGSIIATYETSLYDEWGRRRKEFGLAPLFGASFTGNEEGPMLNSYLTLEKDPNTGKFHPILSGFEDATRIINGVHRVKVVPAGSAGIVPCPLTVVPTYPDLPMESVFPRSSETKDAGVFLRDTGKGRVVYFPWDIDRTFWEVLDLDHGKLIANAVLWAHQEQQPLTVKGPGVLDVSIWEQRGSMTVHLVNLTNPMMMKGPVREIIPLGAQQLRVKLPSGKRVSRSQLLVAKREIAHREANGYLEFEIPSIALHEVLALDFAG
jgi:hypothetical protein